MRVHSRSSASRQDVWIALVEDEYASRDLIIGWLRKAGYPAEGFESADAAWGCLVAHECRVLLLDIVLPGTSGLEFLRRVHNRHPITQVVMLTGLDDAATAVDALTHGASGYLIKPLARDELLLQVGRALERFQTFTERRWQMDRLESRVRVQSRATHRAYEETIDRLLTASMFRDEETGAHVRRTGLFSEVLAKGLGWPTDQVQTIRLAAPMHDVGKIGIPDAILRKPGRLTPEERRIMETHTSIGEQMLAGSAAPMLRMAAEIALNHHERWDGSGYPRGLADTLIPEPARIVSVVDVFDALSHARVYRPAFPEARVLRMLRDGRGTQFEPRILDCFLDALAEIRRIAAEHSDERASSGWRPDTMAFERIKSFSADGEFSSRG